MAQRVPGALGSQISRHSAHEGGEVVRMWLWLIALYIIFVLSFGEATIVFALGSGFDSRWCHWNFSVI